MGKILSILWVIFLIWTIVFTIHINAKIQAEVTGWYWKAETASDAEQMKGFLNKTTEGLEKLDLTTGYHAIVFKTPNTDMNIDYRVIKRLQYRLTEIGNYPVGSMDYAESLTDVRQQLSMLNFSPAYGYLVKHYSWLLWFWLLGFWLLPIPLCIIFWGSPFKCHCFTSHYGENNRMITDSDHYYWRWFGDRYQPCRQHRLK
jgi:hypothetical protein